MEELQDYSWTELDRNLHRNDYGSSKPVVLGSDYQASPTEAFNGHVDEVRISKASARFTAGFTPTTSEYGSDNNTVLLLHASNRRFYDLYRRLWWNI